MNNAKLYKKSNPMQRRDAEQIMAEFSHYFEANQDGSTLLDIGCGSGDVLVEIILPKVSNDFSKVVGVDISKEMTKYANDNYENKFLKFLKLDIESDFLSPEKTDKRITTAMGQIRPESFNFITSFYCLHWIQNQRQAISNIYKLLKPNGTCLLTFLVSNPIFDIYLELSRMKKYSMYMSDVESIISPFHFMSNPLEVFREKLCDVGFKILHIEIRDQIFIYDNIELLKYAIKAVNPFTGRMPEKLQDDFFNDYVKIVDNLNLIQTRVNSLCKRVITPYKLMVALATK